MKILVGDSGDFLKRVHPKKLKVLLSGLIDGTIEVRALNEPFPQSFLLVDDERVYIFFLSVYQENYSEAIRAESPSLNKFFILTWNRFWEDATPLTLDKILDLNP